MRQAGIIVSDSSTIYSPWGKWNRRIIAESREPFSVHVHRPGHDAIDIFSYKAKDSDLQVLDEKLEFDFEFLQIVGTSQVGLTSPSGEPLLICSASAYERIRLQKVLAWLCVVTWATLVVAGLLGIAFGVILPRFTNLS